SQAQPASAETRCQDAFCTTIEEMCGVLLRKAHRSAESLGGWHMNIVLGATGNIGREVVRALRAMHQPVRAVVRDPANAAGRVGESIEVVAGDLEEPVSLVKAFTGGGVLFLLAPVAPTQAEMELAALRAARVAGVRRVVQLSSIGADPLAGGDFTQAHGIVEAALPTSGLGWAIVRGAFFYSKLLFAPRTSQGHY